LCSPLKAGGKFGAVAVYGCGLRGRHKQYLWLVT
jgi:hypothetical protein